MKSQIGTCMQSLLDSLPVYSEADFCLIQRQNDLGVWKAEVWTKRDFGTNEIMLAPVSSQIKTAHCATCSHVLLTLPKKRKGVNPENQSLALDGRGKTRLAKKGALDDEEHLGSLFWLVDKTSDPSLANLVLEDAQFEQQVKVNLPGAKRPKVETLTWNPQEMPCVPLLVNKKPLDKHTKLVAYHRGTKQTDKKVSEKPAASSS